MDKVLIAGIGSAFHRELVEMLRRRYDITTCGDGRTALELLQSLRPRAFIYDLTLPELEGIYVLEQALEFRPPILLCISDFCNDYVAQTLQDLGVDYIFRTPCQPRTVLARLDHLCAHVPSPGHCDLQTRTGQILLSLGIPPKSDGFRYLKIAITLYFQDSTLLLCKEIYGAIAQLNGLSGWKPVEHSIRKSICLGWNTGNPRWAELFPGAMREPSNKAFICRISQLLEEG